MALSLEREVIGKESVDIECSTSSESVCPVVAETAAMDDVPMSRAVYSAQLRQNVSSCQPTHNTVQGQPRVTQVNGASRIVWNIGARSLRSYDKQIVSPC